jgi:hypothetical protein
MSNSVPITNAYRPARRSTRINQPVAMTIQGLDSFRAPYTEKVSTLAVNCHGCTYLSKYDVLPSSWVTLELNDKKESKPIEVKARVKWIMRSPDVGNGMFQTAVEFDQPGNVWGIDSPPADWQPFSGPRIIESDKAKPFAVPKPDAPAASAKTEKPNTVHATPERKTVPPPSGKQQPRVGQLMGQFQNQMEAMLAEAAAAAVHERAANAIDDMRAGVREESKQILAETITSQINPCVDQALKQIKQAGQETARVLHTHWTKKLDADVQAAIGRIELRQRELEQLSENLASHTLERVQEVLDASRKEAVDRIVSRLKEQIAPQVEQARKVTAEMTQRSEQMERMLRESVEKFSARIEDACTGFEKQFQLILQERLDTAREALERLGNENAIRAMNDLRASSKRQETEAQTRLRDGFSRVAAEAQDAIKNQITHPAGQVAGEQTNYTRSHLDYDGGAISELATRIGTHTTS